MVDGATPSAVAARLMVVGGVELGDEARDLAKHPLRLIGEIVNEVLVALDADFTTMYAAFGRPSIAPERGVLHDPVRAPAQ